MPSDLVLKSMNAVHRALLRVSGGRIGRDVGGMPVLELITTGRRSGAPRAVMLTSPLREGDAYVVVASRGGDDRHPAWFLNLRDDPQVMVAVRGGPRVAMRANVATAEERTRMWPQIAVRYRNYAGYQKRTRREIPLVLLRPVDQ
jgi:deazaflavin-dependent oxidoreductase (nitroreductase family)